MTRHRSAIWVCACLTGCAGFYDEITSRDFNVRHLVVAPDPMTVLAESSDGDARAKAYRRLREPSRSGRPDDQDRVVQMLSTAAVSESPLARMAAIHTLGSFQDPRAVPALVAAYDAASTLSPEVAVPVRCQALAALGSTQNPAAVEFLARVAATKGDADRSERERQQARDVRLAAVRSLGSFRQSPDAADVVRQIAATDRDVAVRDRARQSFEQITGQEIVIERFAPPIPAGPRDDVIPVSADTLPR